MFIGEYKHSLDNKNRLAVPTKFRQKLKSGAVVTRGLDNCLFLYTKDEWQKLAEKIAKLPINQASTRAFSRLMLAGAMDVKPDSHGRIVLPQYLKKLAGIKRQTVIAGLYDRLEIWDEEKWNNYTKETEKNSSDIAEKIGVLED